MHVLAPTRDRPEPGDFPAHPPRRSRYDPRTHLMRSEDLKHRVAELEREISALRERSLLPPIGIRRRATWTIARMPLYDIALGSAPGRREMRGHARGIIAIGDVA